MSRGKTPQEIKAAEEAQAKLDQEKDDKESSDRQALKDELRKELEQEAADLVKANEAAAQKEQDEEEEKERLANPRYVFRSKYELTVGFKIKDVHHNALFHNCTFVADQNIAKAWDCTIDDIKKAITGTGGYKTDYLLVGGTNVEITPQMADFNKRASAVMGHKEKKVVQGVRTTGD